MTDTKGLPKFYSLLLRCKKLVVIIHFASVLKVSYALLQIISASSLFPSTRNVNKFMQMQTASTFFLLLQVSLMLCLTLMQETPETHPSHALISQRVLSFETLIKVFPKEPIVQYPWSTWLCVLLSLPVPLPASLTPAPQGHIPKLTTCK